jgi:hypothetical protein
MASEPTAPTETPPSARELDVERLNFIGQWIAQGHVSERVLMCLHMRSLYHELRATMDQRKAKSPNDPSVKAAEPVANEMLDALFKVIRGFEDGEHINANSCPNWYLFQIEVGGALRTFALPPNENAMATDPAGVPREWSSLPNT